MFLLDFGPPVLWPICSLFMGLTLSLQVFVHGLLLCSSSRLGAQEIDFDGNLLDLNAARGCECFLWRHY